MTDPDAWLASAASSVLANSELITMARISPLEPGGPALVLRRLNYGRWRHRLRDIFRMTRAERAFWNSLKLERAGIATAHAVAVGVERLARWPKRAYLLTEWISGALPLNDWLARERSLPRAQMYRLAELLARLHNNGFSHRDLKASNVLFNEQLQPCLIDLDGVRKYRAISQSRAVADLSRFAWEFVAYPLFFKWNARRFLRRYCQLRNLNEHLSSLYLDISKPVLRRLATGMTKWKD
jgi:tRNA A-37 threonylcarbamoyl transferase component Bud32